MTLKDALIEAQGALLESIDQRARNIDRLVARARPTRDAQRTLKRESQELWEAYARIETEYVSLERAEAINHARELLAIEQEKVQ